jgi:hypothetical protein
MERLFAFMREAVRIVVELRDAALEEFTDLCCITVQESPHQ